MLLLVMLAGIPTLSAQTKKEKKEQKKEAVRQLIVSEDYKIDVNTAMPMRGRSIPLTSQYCKSEMIRYSLTSLITDVLTAFLTAEEAG
jgi:hypothetical protein